MKVKCLNCGAIFIATEIDKDENGPYTICPECGKKMTTNKADAQKGL